VNFLRVALFIIAAKLIFIFNLATGLIFWQYYKEHHLPEYLNKDEVTGGVYETLGSSDYIYQANAKFYAS